MARKESTKVNILSHEIDLLQKENTHLKNKLRLLGEEPQKSVFTIPDKLKVLPKSITGLEGMYIQIDNQNRIINLNQNMANLLNIEKNTAFNKKIEEVDQLPWARGVLGTLIEESRILNEEVQWETHFIDSVTGRYRDLIFRVSTHFGTASITVNDTTKYKRILETFSRYVSPNVIKKMQDLDTDFLATERMNITILFADLRGFTTMSSHMEPHAVKDLLNEFFAEAISVIDRFEGTVDKLIGDAVMVLFGAPVTNSDHAFRGVKTAIELQKAHQKLMTRWEIEDRPIPSLGVGLNSGEVVVGNIGSKTRMDYTAIGHEVNLSSRLCSIANGGEILISENTVHEIFCYVNSHPSLVNEKIQFQKAGQIPVKGLEEKIAVARVLLDKEDQYG